MTDRYPAVAGLFYPQQVDELSRELKLYLSEPENTHQPQNKHKRIKALILPHAGYCYSGAIAGAACALLKQQKHQIKRVVLFGPSHRIALAGCAISSFKHYVTPLGKLAIDQQINQRLLEAGLVSQNDLAHVSEHSLEVELPFLQAVLGDFELVPIIVGQCPADTVSQVIAMLANEPDSLLIFSTDLSHYLSYQQAQEKDNQTIKQIVNVDATLRGDQACGCYAINGLLDYCQQQEPNHACQIELVSKANSGDVAQGDKNKVVGYASFILY